MSASTGHGASVRIEGCGKTFVDGTRALEPATLDIARGETLVLLGPSGCGKTTMLRIIAGLELPDTGGKVLFDGRDVTSVPIEKRNVGMVFQSYALFPNLSVADNIGYGLKIRGVAKQERASRVAELVALTNISGLENRRINQLSGGQRQRVALARAGFSGSTDATSLPRGEVTVRAWAIDLQNERAFPMAGAVSLRSQR